MLNLLKIKRVICAIIDTQVPAFFTMGLLNPFEPHINNTFFIGYFEIWMSFMWGIILVKDIMGGQSISKKLLGLQIIHRKTALTPKPVITILRNAVALPIFPIEALVYALFDLRIGDLLFNTEVVSTPRKSLPQIWNEIKSLPVKNGLLYLSIAIGAALIGLMIYMYFFSLLFEIVSNRPLLYTI